MKKTEARPPLGDHPHRLAVRHFLTQDATKMQSSALIHEIGDARQREILHLRYEAGLSMVAIALRLHYDLRTVQRHHRRALSLLALRLMHGRTQIEGIDWNRYQAGFFLQLHEKRQHTQEMLSP